MATRLSFRCKDEMVQRVDRARQSPLGRPVAREAWLRDAVEIALRQAEAVEVMARDESGEYQRRAAERALEEPSAPGLASRSAETLAPAEQPKEKPGDLWFARPREFHPYPKAADRKKKR